MLFSLKQVETKNPPNCSRTNGSSKRLLPRTMAEGEEKKAIEGIKPEPESQRQETQELVKCIEIKRGEELNLEPLHNTKGFCEFIEGTPKETLVRFFRGVHKEIEESRGIQDYHFKIKDNRGKRPGFMIQVFYGEKRDGPEKIEEGACISCNADAPLFPDIPESMLAGECVLEDLSEKPYVLCSIDAKARPGFIITPVRHVERMSELDDEELVWLWRAAVRALRCGGVSGFMSMILNHGTYRNLPHLHLKTWIHDSQHHKSMELWSDHRKGVWTRLQALATSVEPSKKKKKRGRCAFFDRTGRCKYQDRCRFLH